MKIRNLYILQCLFFVGFMFGNLKSEAQSIPTDTFPQAESSLSGSKSLPWNDISLTGVKMKPGGPFLPATGFHWLPVLGGAISGGALAYIILQGERTTVDCDFVITTQVRAATCNLANGSAEVNVTPDGEYQFAWSNGDALNNIQFVTAGNYLVTVTHVPTSCTRTLSVIVPNDEITFSATANVQDADCGMTNGTATITTEPPGDYTYSWSDGSNGPSQVNLPPGSYTVTVNAGGPCMEVVDFTVNELSPSFEVAINTQPSICNSATGSATVIATPQAAYSYHWSHGSNTSEVNGLSPGEYQVTVTLDGTSCSKEIMVTIGELQPDFEISAVATSASCGMANGTATVVVTPEGEYQYNWSGGGNTATLSALTAGVYTVTVSTSPTCWKTAQVTVTELPPDFTIVISSAPSACEQATGMALLQVFPPGNYLFEWSNGSVESQLTNISEGTYQVSVTLEGTTCTIDTTVVVEALPASFSIQTSSTPSGCTDSTGTAHASVDPKGDYTYQWSNGMTGPDVTGLHASTYSVTVTLAGTSCSMVSMVTIGQTKINFTGNVSVDDATCGLHDGSATVTITPEGSYTYLWPDLQTGSTAQQLSPGNYIVTVTDMNGCSSSFMASISQEEASYITVTGSSPGNCAGGGEILFTLFTSGPGPLYLQVNGPAGMMSWSLQQGSYSLSALMNVTPGSYTMIAYDQVIGDTCNQMIDLFILDNTPLIQALNDAYSTIAGEPVQANVLQNDVGLNLAMTMVQNITGGIVTFNTDGSFVFIPNPGFIGEASFTYIVTDTCGMTSEAMVLIEVMTGNCDFTIESTLIPATCGLDDGSISVEVIEEGMYAYVWDIGETGPVISNLLSGPYAVTIEDLLLGCSLAFNFILPELPPDYINDVEVTQPTCETPGEISFVLSSPDMNSMEMTVTHPNGINNFSVDEGLVILSDYVSIVAGSYVIEVMPEDAAPECLSSFEVMINQVPQLEIMLEAVFPPSEPTAMDGAIIAVVTTQGSTPYNVFLNGVLYGTTIEQLIVVEGIGFGEHTLQIVDNNGCASNVLLVLVPFPGLNISIGAGLFQSMIESSTDAQNATSAVLQNGVTASIQFPLGRMMQDVILTKSIPGYSIASNGQPETGLSVDYFTELWAARYKRMKFRLRSGMGINNAKNDLPLFHWNISAGVKVRIGRQLLLHTNLTVPGWEEIYAPCLDVNIRIPVSSGNSGLSLLKRYIRY